MEKLNDIAVSSLLKCLIESSEKGAKIAQACRSEEELFKLLVEEKTDDAKNKRFFQDFKTLADVLVQETVRWELSRKFPEISCRIQGEESNHFQNLLGESIEVQICDTESKTAAILLKVLDGNESAAHVLAKCAHQEINLEVDVETVPHDLFLPSESISIWIDPIDSTSEYISGCFEEPGEDGLVKNGLQCVCTLIGAYDCVSGKPIVGIVNQPFHSRNSDGNGWQSKYYWGVSHMGVKKASIQSPSPKNCQKKVVTSSFEDSKLLQILSSHYDVSVPAGAGYKCLSVGKGNADLYILSRSSTYMWDTCGPHALLYAMGGGIVEFHGAVRRKYQSEEINFDSLQLSYNSSTNSLCGIQPFCNVNGLIAYRNQDDLTELIKILIENGFDA